MPCRQVKLPSLWTYLNDHVGTPIGTTGIRGCVLLVEKLGRAYRTLCMNLQNTICTQAHTALASVALNVALACGGSIMAQGLLYWQGYSIQHARQLQLTILRCASSWSRSS